VSLYIYHLPPLGGLSDEQNVTMTKLILSHLYCVQFGLDDTLTESGQDSAYVFDLLTDFGLYRRECSKSGEGETYQVWIPKLLASFLENQFQFERGTLSVLLRTIHTPVHFFCESSCRVLKGLVATKFCCLLLCVTMKILYCPRFLSCLPYGVKWTWCFRVIQLHFMFCPLYIFRKHLKNKEG